MDIKGLHMTLLFTPEELVQYLYNETSPARTAEIEEALLLDWTLREKLEILQISMQALNRTPLEAPRTEAVMNILNYARETVSESVQHH
jgi:hypothetical protein